MLNEIQLAINAIRNERDDAIKELAELKEEIQKIKRETAEKEAFDLYMQKGREEFTNYNEIAETIFYPGMFKKLEEHLKLNYVSPFKK